MVAYLSVQGGYCGTEFILHHTAGQKRRLPVLKFGTEMSAPLQVTEQVQYLVVELLKSLRTVQIIGNLFSSRKYLIAPIHLSTSKQQEPAKRVPLKDSGQ